MAKLEGLLPFIEKWEGGYVNDPYDLGGATNMGVTIGTWKTVGYDKDGDGDIDEDDVRLITKEDMAECVLRPHYWNRCRADEIKSQTVANIFVDWVWASGVAGIKGVQELVGVKVDGIVGDKTLAAINAASQRDLFLDIKRARVDYVERICVSRPANLRFRKGWLRRIEDISWMPVVMLLLLLVSTGCRTKSNSSSHTYEIVKTETLSDAVISGEMLQKVATSTTLQAGEKLEIEIMRREYNTLTPDALRYEVKTVIHKRTDLRQEQAQNVETVQEVEAHIRDETQQEAILQSETKSKSEATGRSIGWLWLALPVLCGVVYVVLRFVY